MIRRRFTACLGAFTLALAPLLHGAATASASSGLSEYNLWPARVERIDDSGRIRSWQGAGPLAFSRDWPDGRSVSGVRPFWVEWKSPDGTRALEILYPFFRKVSDSRGDRWSILQLANDAVSNEISADGKMNQKGFDLWPFWFSRETGHPESSYKALFPAAGIIKNRFGNDRMEWFLFPLYGRFQTGERVTTTTPWPFVRHHFGGGQNGWSFWPFYGWREQAGESRSRFALWPLFYRQETRLSDPVPSVSWGLLPFYAVDRSPEAVSETWLWPFFGYLDRKEPAQYHETRWLWPLWVQGRGAHQSRERWAPFYTHSLSKSGEKTWILWPLWREQKWSEAGLAHTKHQFLYFLYWSLEQRRPGASDSAPAASKTHLWPLFSAWNNGAGRSQIQVLSPFEVFFQHNDSVRAAYSPIFSLYQYSQDFPGATRHALLWEAITLSQNASTGNSEFHLGPLLAVHAQPNIQRVSFFGGLFGIHRTPGERAWRAFTRSSSHQAGSVPSSQRP